MNRFISNNKYMIPILFDVSLRDGIQGANPLHYPTNKKIDILRSICQNQSPDKIEIGAFVSPKVLPIMSDTAKLFDITPSIIQSFGKPVDIYALVPNKIGLLHAIKCGCKNFSFITSISNAFQVKNTGKNLLYKKTELHEMLQYIANMNLESKTKLYVSCVNECPITGLIDNDFIIYEILSSYGNTTNGNYNETYDEICISDTMGTLKVRDFEYIVDGLMRFGIASSRISLHLHVNSENAEEAKRILFACFRREIHKFDASVISKGGCSVTMNTNQLKPNMTYDFFYNTLREFKLENN